MKYADIIQKMTLEEKASLCSGGDFWHTKAVKSVNLPSIMMSDGPHGLRKQGGKGDHLGMNGSLPATCFPLACATGSSWDPELLEEMGELLGDECRKEQISVLLGPGVNMKRSPLCGRNFEYFSEDPYLSGKLACGWIKGLQSKGIGASLKHFAGNSQETRRMTIDSIIDERALREIYLPAFETAVKEAHPWTVMNAYNKVNGTYCAENQHLLTKILREEWGFDGLVETDWGAENDRVAGLIAGQEIEMPSSGGMTDKTIVKAVKKGQLDEAVLDRAVDRIIELVQKSQPVLQKTWDFDVNEHHAKAREFAGRCGVLLKNEDHILPLKKEGKLAVIGEMARQARYQGAGSSKINPTLLDNACHTMEEQGIPFTFAPGYKNNDDAVDQSYIDEAVKAAKEADHAILYVGLFDAYESEGFDREHTCLPQNHNKLIEAVAAVNPNVIVVLSGGSSVEMPWIGQVKAVLNCSLGGQAGGSASVDLLFGDVNPSGKLAETYAVKFEDNPSHENFPGNQKTVEYRESIYIGYRYYDKVGKDVLFPFGFGLSYTEFEYTDFRLDKSQMMDTDTLTATVQIKNIGQRDGAEVVQFYISDVESTIFKAPKELKGFQKVFLKAGETKEVSVSFDRRSFAYYNTNIHDWHVESGEYKICVGASSRDIRFEQSVTVNSSQPEVSVPDYRESAPVYYNGDPAHVDAPQFETILGRPIPASKHQKGEAYTVSNTLADLSEEKVGNKIVGLIHWVIFHLIKSDVNSPEMMFTVVSEFPIRSLCTMTQGAFSEKMADSLVTMCSGRFWKGLGGFVSGIPALLVKLPKIL